MDKQQSQCFNLIVIAQGEKLYKSCSEKISQGETLLEEKFTTL